MYYILFFIMIYLIYLLYNINIIQLETLAGTKFTIYNNNIEEKQILLSKVIEDMIKLKKHLFEIQNDFPEYKPYIIQLNKNFTNSRTKINETNPFRYENFI